MAKRLKIIAPELFSDLLKRSRLGTLSDLAVPKEVMQAAVTNIEKFRQGVLDAVSNEIEKNLARVDVAKVLDHVLKNYTVKLSAEVRLEPKRKKKGSAK